MGKKRNKDIWDLSAEEQEKNAEEMAAFADGTILSLGKVKTGLPESGLPVELEALVAHDFSKESEESNEEYQERPLTNAEILLKDKQKGKLQNSTLYGVIKEYAAKEEKKKNNNIRRINFKYFDDLRRFIVDDGFAPTSYSCSVGMSQLIIGSYDIDQSGENVSELYRYMISLKHPTAIYDYEDFVSDKYSFCRVVNDSYNHDKFMFMVYRGKVFAYVIDEDSKDVLFDALDDLSDDPNKILGMFVSLAYDCGTLHQAFFVEDSDYVDAFFNSKYNQRYLVSKVFENDELTNMVDRTNDPVNFSIILNDIQECQSFTRNMIIEMTGPDGVSSDDITELFNYDDEDEDDTEEVDDKEIDIPDMGELNEKLDDATSVTHTVTSLTTEEVTITSNNQNDGNQQMEGMEEIELPDDVEIEEVDNDLISDDMSIVSTDAPAEVKKPDVLEPSDSDDDMTIPVIRKK